MKRLVLTSSITSIMSGNDEGRLGPDSWSETNAYSDSGEAPEGISTNIPRLGCRPVSSVTGAQRPSRVIMEPTLCDVQFVAVSR
jgi:hypothetical protein